jgi:kynureninase
LNSGHTAAPPDSFEDSGEFAERLDTEDTLAGFRKRFAIPKTPDGGDQLYFCGNSLGLMPLTAEDAVLEVLRDWKSRAVAAHFDSEHPWMPYHEFLRKPLARLVGARPREVVAMNSLTVNLHLMMVSFFRPTNTRHRIVIEKGAFPSDRYAVVSQLHFHGLDPETSLVELAPEDGSAVFAAGEVEAWLRENGEDVALVLWPGVQYYSGEAFDLASITRAALDAGATIGFDLAHAAGNLELNLHDSGCDFAVWCSYKYMNGGPGAVAGCFVHDRHEGAGLPRFAGWWGHDRETRFRMGPDFVPAPGADAWQLSNPPILAMAPVRASLAVFDEAGMSALHAKSRRMTAYARFLLTRRLPESVEILTPSDADRHGCQLSLRLRGGNGRDVFRRLEAGGVVCDWREPDVIRVAPVPLYNRFTEVRSFVDQLEAYVKDAAG